MLAFKATKGLSKKVQFQVRHYNNHNEEGSYNSSNCKKVHDSIVGGGVSSSDFDKKKYPKRWPKEGYIQGKWYENKSKGFVKIDSKTLYPKLEFKMYSNKARGVVFGKDQKLFFKYGKEEYFKSLELKLFTGK